MNVKPGDLAYIVTTNTPRRPTPGIAGRVVKVVRRAAPHEQYTSTCGQPCSVHPSNSSVVGWVVEAKEPLPWFIDSVGSVLMFHRREVGDPWLRRIGGVDPGSETPTAEPIDLSELAQ